MKIKDRVIQLIIDHLELDPAEVVPEAHFIDDLGISSMDLWELVLVMEDEFGLEVPDEDLEKIGTVQDAIHFIETHAEPKQ
jgi:acyl carrier protein